MISPFSLPPHPLAQAAAAKVMDRVHAYMRVHPESELHRQGKMFGVLIVKNEVSQKESYIAAFSAMLDGSYQHEGFVPPVLTSEGVNKLTDEQMPVGHSREESRQLQRLLFAQYRLQNGRGETKNLLEIFAKEKAILSAEEYFHKSSITQNEAMPPSGAGECCAPKLLQYAFLHGLKPIAMAEFWIGAPSRTEIRQEGCFYAPCSGKCVPILKHMLQGIEIDKTEDRRNAETLCQQIKIIYEDEWLMVVDKPSGLLSVPGKGEELSCENYLKCQMDEKSFLKAVHRLDQDTSGLLVLAKNAEVYKELQAYFQRRDIDKRYEAVVECTKEQTLHEGEEGLIDLPLLPNPYDRPRQMVNKEHGKVALTRYRIREHRADGTLLVDFFPLTGRTHQLRVHAAHPDGLKAPIAGDRLYGRSLTESLNGKRLMLHAAEIRFIHPVTKEELHFCIPSEF